MRVLLASQSVQAVIRRVRWLCSGLIICSCIRWQVVVGESCLREINLLRLTVLFWVSSLIMFLQARRISLRMVVRLGCGCANKRSVFSVCGRNCSLIKSVIYWAQARYKFFFESKQQVMVAIFCSVWAVISRVVAFILYLLNCVSAVVISCFFVCLFLIVMVGLFIVQFIFN